MNKKLLALALISFLSLSHADKPKPNLDLLKSNLTLTSKIKSVKESPIPGLYEVQVNGYILYLTEDGNTLVRGDIYDLNKRISYTEKALGNLRKIALAKVEDKDAIVYKAKDEKYTIDVFTDISCPYCTKLHQHIDEFNAMGITVRYLAFPRAGLGSSDHLAMQKIWCAKDKQKALTQAKIKSRLPKEECEGNQVVDQFLMAGDIGVNATPTIILSDGGLISGYMKPKDLLKVLKENFSR